MSHIQRRQPGVAGAIAHVEPAIGRSGVLIGAMRIGRTKTCQCVDGKADTVRPRVVAVEIESLAEPQPGVQQKAVVTLRSAVVQLRYGSERLYVGRSRIRQLQQAPLIQIRRLRARSRSGESVLPWRTVARNKKARVQFDSIPCVDEMRSNIRCRREPARRHLTLDADIPLILFGGSQIRRNWKEPLICRRRWKYRMCRIEVVRERTPGWKRIVQTDHRRQDAEPERRNRRRVLVQIHANEVVRNTAAEANGHLAVTAWVPRDARARLEVLPLALHS